MKNYLTIEQVSFTYAQSQTPALQGISFSVRQGDFVTLYGGTGSGKTTLLRLLKQELTPRGMRTGLIWLESKPLEQLSPKQQARTIGFVMQKPEQQIVTDTVWHELAFGLENIGMPKQEIASRIAETASYFGITDWYLQKTDTLSGGQKQLLNLAAVMAMQPDILLLDEPTAQLDPIAASEFIAALERLHRELSLTILLSEHCLEEVLPLSNQLLVLEKGRLVACDTPKAVISQIREKPTLLSGMPTAARLGAAVGVQTDIPLRIQEGRDLVAQFRQEISSPPERPILHTQRKALEIRDVTFRYAVDMPQVLCHASLTVYEQEIVSLFGANGSGKTTLLAVAAKLCKPQGGTVSLFGKKLKTYHNTELYRNCLAMLPQDVQVVFLRDTVREELENVAALPFVLDDLMDKHPYDLSGGEQQMVAFLKILRYKPRLLLLDEPSKGMDANAKVQLAQVLQQLRQEGMTILFTTHDIAFAGMCADRCALCFRGEIVSQAASAAFMDMHRFYTTPANRIARGTYTHVVTVEEAAALCLENGLRTESEAEDANDSV